MGTTVAIGRDFLRSGFLRHFSGDSKRPSFNDAYLWIQVYVNGAETPLHPSGVVGIKRPTKKASIERLLESGWLAQKDGGLVVPQDKRVLAMAGNSTWLWFIPMRFGWLSVPARVSLMLIDESSHGFKHPLAAFTLAKRIGVTKKTLKRVLRVLRSDKQIITSGQGRRTARKIDTYRGFPDWLKVQKSRAGYLRGPAMSVPFVPLLSSVCTPTPFGLDPSAVPFVPHSGSRNHSVGSLWTPSEADRSVPVEETPESRPSTSRVRVPPEEESRLSLLCRVVMKTDPMRDSPTALEPDVIRNCCAAKRHLFQDLSPGGFLAFLLGIANRKVKPFMIFRAAGGFEVVAQESKQTFDGLFELDADGNMDIAGISNLCEEGTDLFEECRVSMHLRQAIAADVEPRTETNGWPESRVTLRLTADQPDPYSTAKECSGCTGCVDCASMFEHWEVARGLHLEEQFHDPTETDLSRYSEGLASDDGHPEWDSIVELLEGDPGDRPWAEEADMARDG